jgi:hydroxymethylpyrimidine/phosphomethylpyrimidine kinase
VPPDFLRKQLKVLLADFSPQAVKTGMLLTAENVAVVASIAKRHGLVNLVVDPVIRSSSGKGLANRDAVAAMKKRLLPLARVVTPNLYEASVLSGIPVRNRHDMEKAAGILKKLGPQAVIVTGGHLESEAADLVLDGSGIHYLRGVRVVGQYHGTGCTFSAALAVSLAEGRSVREAAASAKRFVKKAFGKYLEISGGMRLFHV